MPFLLAWYAYRLLRGWTPSSVGVGGRTCGVNARPRKEEGGIIFLSENKPEAVARH